MKGKKSKTKKAKAKEEAKKQEKEEKVKTEEKVEESRVVEEAKKQEEAVSAPQAKEEAKKPADYAKQTKAIVLFMAVVLISLAAVYWITQEGKTSSFNGIEFQKTKEGTLVFYKSLMGYVTSTGEEIPFVLKLRINPKKLEKIPATGNIKVLEEAIVSISPQILNCSKTYISAVDLAMTLKAFGTTSVGATNDRDYSIKNNVTLADCSNSTNKTVIIFREGTKTQVYQDEDFKNCYVIEIKDCEVREGYERFLLEYIQDSFMNKD